MKLAKITSIVSVALLFSAMVPSVFAESTYTAETNHTCSYQTCMDIVEDAMEQYAIDVPNVDEYKAYVWTYTQDNSFSAEQLQREFQETFGRSSANKAQYSAGEQDTVANCAEEVIEVLNEINTENHTNYVLGAGSFDERAKYVVSLSLDRDTFKSKLENELLSNQQGELVEKLRIEDPDENSTIASPLSIHEQITQHSSAILYNSISGSNTIATGDLTSIIFSATGNPGSYIYESFIGCNMDYGAATGGGFEYGNLRETETIMTVHGYIGLSYVTGQMRFSLKNL